MSDSSKAGTEREDLVEFLKEQRDEYEAIHDDTGVESGAQYAKGRLHSYCDVLAWLMANGESGEDFLDWLQKRREKSGEQYRTGGPRSENPRQSDIALGKHRAYKNVYQEFLERQQGGEANE